jgi:hypothetical protein
VQFNLPIKTKSSQKYSQVLSLQHQKYFWASMIGK